MCGFCFLSFPPWLLLALTIENGLAGRARVEAVDLTTGVQQPCGVSEAWESQEPWEPRTCSLSPHRFEAVQGVCSERRPGAGKLGAWGRGLAVALAVYLRPSLATTTSYSAVWICVAQ